MKKNTSKTAFSLVELSVVILIIGIILAGITQSSRLIRQFQLSTARTLSESSPVASIPDLVAWFDAVKEESTSGATSADFELENEDEVLAWNSIIPTLPQFSLTTTAGTGPQYIEEGINGLPALLFDRTDADERLSGDFVGYDENYTIFIVVEKFSDPLVFSDIVDIKFTYDGVDLVHYNSIDPSGIFSVANNSFAASDSAISDDTPTLISYVYNSIADSSVLYINEIEQTGLGDLNAPSSSYLSTEISIGGHMDDDDYVLDGYVGEVIFYNRPLKTEERTAVEEYLTKKWKL